MKTPNQSSVSTALKAAANRYRQAEFLISVNSLGQLPADDGREVACAGRSNAGKSSALNLLTEQRQLARVSKTPGRTQLINFFQVTSGRYLVDLPGYGYAQAPAELRRHWGTLLEGYVRDRQALRGMLLLMDVRHPLTELDQLLLDYCRMRNLPVHILLTKADKLSRGAAAAALQAVQKTLRQAYPQVTAQLFSAQTAQGAERVYQQLDAWLGFAENVAPLIAPT